LSARAGEGASAGERPLIPGTVFVTSLAPEECRRRSRLYRDDFGEGHLNELASVSRRTLGLSWEDVGDALAALRVLYPSATPLTTDTHDAGLRIAAKYGFPFYDALIAAAALEAECTTLYSEDFQDG